MHHHRGKFLRRPPQTCWTTSSRAVCTALQPTKQQTLPREEFRPNTTGSFQPLRTNRGFYNVVFFWLLLLITYLFCNQCGVIPARSPPPADRPSAQQRVTWPQVRGFFNQGGARRPAQKLQTFRRQLPAAASEASENLLRTAPGSFPRRERRLAG